MTHFTQQDGEKPKIFRDGNFVTIKVKLETKG